MDSIFSTQSQNHAYIKFLRRRFPRVLVKLFESTCSTTVLVLLRFIIQFYILGLSLWAIICSSDPFFELDPILAAQIRPITIRFKPSTDHLQSSNPIQIIIHWQGKNLLRPKQTWISAIHIIVLFAQKRHLVVGTTLYSVMGQVS